MSDERDHHATSDRLKQVRRRLAWVEEERASIRRDSAAFEHYIRALPTTSRWRVVTNRRQFAQATEEVARLQGRLARLNEEQLEITREVDEIEAEQRAADAAYSDPSRWSRRWWKWHVFPPVATVAVFVVSIVVFGSWGSAEPEFFAVAAQVIPVLLLVLAVDARMFQQVPGLPGMTVANVLDLGTVLAAEAACLVVLAGRQPTWFLSGLVTVGLVNLCGWLVVFTVRRRPGAR